MKNHSDPFQNERADIRTCSRRSPCHNRQKRPPSRDGRLNGKLTRLFHHNEAGAVREELSSSFPVVRGIDHSYVRDSIAKIRSALQKSDILCMWWASENRNLNRSARVGAYFQTFGTNLNYLWNRNGESEVKGPSKTSPEWREKKFTISRGAFERRKNVPLQKWKP